ncbi:MAG: hypothetical protein GY928_34165 [Colwellia sp.]|nr:hypothetical protein [Colwellia sp.]
MKTLRLVVAGKTTKMIMNKEEVDITPVTQWEMKRGIREGFIFETYSCGVNFGVYNVDELVIALSVMVTTAAEQGIICKRKLRSTGIYRETNGTRELLYLSNYYRPFEKVGTGSHCQVDDDILGPFIEVGNTIIGLGDNWQDYFGDSDEPHPSAINHYSPLGCHIYPLELSYTTQRGLCLRLWDETGTRGRDVVRFDGCKGRVAIIRKGVNSIADLNDIRVNSEDYATALYLGVELAHKINRFNPERYLMEIKKADGTTYWQLKPSDHTRLLGFEVGYE